jgi:hypothetical protein
MSARSIHARLFAIAAIVLGFGLSEALSAGDVLKGAWKLEMPPPRDTPYLTFYDANHKTVFRFGCGVHYELDAVYPGSAAKQDAADASITIANGKTQMDFAGNLFLLEADATDWPPHTTMFNQGDLGHRELEGAKWDALEDAFLEFLDSGRPLTISAEGKSYVLPAVNVPRWRARFRKIC